MSDRLWPQSCDSLDAHTFVSVSVCLCSFNHAGYSTELVYGIERREELKDQKKKLDANVGSLIQEAHSVVAAEMAAAEKV